MIREPVQDEGAPCPTSCHGKRRHRARWRLWQGGFRLLPLLVLALLWVPAHGHQGQPPLIDFWGPFTPQTAHCQRLLSRVEESCLRAVRGVLDRCREARLAGAACDEAADATAIEAALAAASEAVAAACTEQQVVELHFSSLREAISDVTTTCRGEALAIASLLDLPLSSGGGNVSEAERACMQAATTAAAHLLAEALRTKRTVLHAVAVAARRPGETGLLQNRARARMARLRTVLGDRLPSRCPDFAALYRQSPTRFLVNVELRAECVLFGSHYQAAYPCPRPECGNGVREGFEECDDANRNDHDACRNDCTAASGGALR